MRELWLNGWRRDRWTVLIGSGLRCAGCGKILGVVCVVLNGPLPDEVPNWPFEEETCPVHIAREDVLKEEDIQKRKAAFAKFEKRIKQI